MTVFDAMDNPTRKTDRNGRVTLYDYDQLDRRTPREVDVRHDAGTVERHRHDTEWRLTE